MGVIKGVPTQPSGTPSPRQLPDTRVGTGFRIKKCLPCGYRWHLTIGISLCPYCDRKLS